MGGGIYNLELHGLDFGGGGGILIEGRKSCRHNLLNGEGYGAGGGEDDQEGSAGVVVLMLCDF